MTSLLSSYMTLPRPLQAGLSVVAGGSIVGAVMLAASGYPMVAGVIFIGFVVLCALLLAFKGFLKWRQRVKATPFAREIGEAGSAVPQGANAASRANLDDLRKKWDEGFNTFRKSGVNIYSLPWYVFIGEPGSGKTEAVRHCNIPRPPGLQNELQGAGGTINMDWWFTNHAVILDTAGKMVMSDVDSPASTLWTEFLKLLARHRPNCPINGLLLAISAESLINDNNETMEKKGGKLARQLDHIQRALGVRFPVFVVITKSDKINGFRDFFEHIGDPQLQHQIFGWSNPAPLDEQFKPEQVERCLQEIRTKLVRRRQALLRDPIHTEEESGRRVDQVDSMYDFPNELVNQISGRLRRYLEMIFVAGTWATKPLFLRGIYLTSAMREGEELDKALADLYGVPVESLPGGRGWTESKSYFLRELFLNKVFLEKGLVTRAGNTKRLQQRRRKTLLTTASAGLLLVLGLTLWGAWGLRQSVLEPKNFWQSALAELTKTDKGGRPIPPAIVDNRNEWVFDAAGRPEVELSTGSFTPAGAVKEVQAQDEDPIPVDWIFVMPNGWRRDLLVKERKEASRAFFEQTVLKPLVDKARQDLATKTDETEWGDVEVQALAQLIRLEVAAVKSPEAQLFRLEPLLKYALRAPDSKEHLEAAVAPQGVNKKSQADELQEMLDGLYSGVEPGVMLGAGSQASRQVIEGALVSFQRSAIERMGNGIHPDVELVRKSLGSLQEAEANLQALADRFPTGQYKQALADWNDLDQVRGRYGVVVDRAKEVENALQSKDLGGLQSGALVEINKQLVQAALTDLERQRDEFREALKPLEFVAVGKLKTDVLELPEDSEDQAKHLEIVHTKIEGTIVKLDKQREEDRDKEFAELQEIHLARTDAEGKPRQYQVRLAAYEIADRELRGSLAESPESWSINVADSLKRLEGTWNQATSILNTHQAVLKASSAKAKALNDNALKLAQEGVKLANQLQTQNVAVMFLRDMPADWKTIAANLAAANSPITSQTAATPDFPAIEFTVLARSEADRKPKREFEPASARQFLESWDKITTALSSNSTQLFRDRAAVQKLYDDRTGTVSEYRTAYFDYWTKEIQDLLRIDIGRLAWGEITRALWDRRASSLNKQLKELAQRRREALQVIAEAQLEPAQKTVRARITSEWEKLNDEQLSNRCDGVRQKWAGLDGEIQSARDEILAMAGSAGPELKDNYFYGIEFHGKTGFDDEEPVQFWSDLTLAVLARLADLCQHESNEALGKLRSEYNRFPICTQVKAETQSWLAEPEFREAQQCVRQCTVRSPAVVAAADATVNSRWDSYSPIKAQLQRLAGGNAQNDQWLQQLQQVMKCFQGQGDRLHCQLVVIEQPAQETVSAVEPYPYFTVRSGESKTLQPIRTNNTDPMRSKQLNDINISIPGKDPVTLSFWSYKDVDQLVVNEDRKPNATVRLAEPWTTLLAFHTLTCQGTDDPKVWKIRLPVVSEEDKRNVSYYWIGLKFTPSVPVHDEWPRCVK